MQRALNMSHSPIYKPPTQSIIILHAIYYCTAQAVTRRFLKYHIAAQPEVLHQSPHKGIFRSIKDFGKTGFGYISKKI